MGRYGRAAILAVNYINDDKLKPKEAWNKATVEIFGEGTQRKGCSVTTRR